MSDNISITPGVGETIASDQIAGVQYQRFKIVLGDDGVNDGDVSSSNPMPVQTRPHSLALLLTASDPAPSGSDITDGIGNAIVSTDLAIRDSSGHYFRIPMADYTQLALGFDVYANPFDQGVRILLYGGFASNRAFVRLFDVTVPASSAIRIGVSSHDGGYGGFSGVSPAANQYHYSVPALTDYEYTTIQLLPTATPTTGEMALSILRK